MAKKKLILKDYNDFEIKDFTEGLIDKVDDNILPPNAAQDCQNWISRIIGMMKKRPGQARLNGTDLGGPVQGMHAYYYGATRKLIVAANGIAYYWDPGTSSMVQLKTGLDTSAQVMFETCVNYMISFNGVNAPWKYDGSTVTTLANAPGDGWLPILHKEKVFVVPKSEPSTLRWSNSFEPETWEAVNYWPVKDGDGDVITCLRKFLGELIVFKRRSIHSFRGTSMDDFRLDELESKIGCVGPFAAVNNGPYIYFVSDEGICVFNGMKVVNLTEQRIPRFWDNNINKEYLHKAAAGVWDGLIWFALPEGDSTYNNLVLIYVPPEEGAVGGKWWPWRGIDAACFLEYNDGTKNLFYSGDANAGYVVQQYVGTDDFGTTPVNAYWEGVAFDAGSAEREKKARKAFISDSPDTPNPVDLQVSLDYGAFNSLTLRRNDGLEREFRFNSNDRWRYLTPKLIHNALGGCEVRGLLIPYKRKEKPKVRSA